MPKIDTTMISGFETMTDAEKVAALLAVEVPERVDTAGLAAKAAQFDKLASELAETKRALKSKMTEDEVAKAEIAKQLLDFKRYCNSKDKYRDITLCQKIVSIVKNLHRVSCELITSGKPLENKKKQTVSQICVDFIKKNIDKPITVQMIAEETFISASHLLHQFKKEMDITLHQYIIFQKIQMATNLLAKGISPLSVAKQLGFNYYSTFYNNFIKYNGYPPSEKIVKHTTTQKNVIE